MSGAPTGRHGLPKRTIYFLGAHKGSESCFYMTSDTSDDFDLMVVLLRTVNFEPLVMLYKVQCSLNTDNTFLKHMKAVDSVFAWPAIHLITLI
jgi:hypothetical protein